MIIRGTYSGGTPVVHHVGWTGRWDPTPAPATAPLDMAWRLASIVLGSGPAAATGPDVRDPDAGERR